MNIQDNIPQNISSENEIPLTSNPLYKLIEIQANRFEEFGNRIKLQLQTLYQEFNKQRDETLKNNLIEFEKIGKIYQKQIEYQSELIDNLIIRIENLEIRSNKKDQDVRNLQEDFNNFLKSNVLLNQIEDVGIKDESTYCEDNFENENLKPSKLSHEESVNNDNFSSCFASNYNLSSSSQINSLDQENQEKVSKFERQFQQLVLQKETLGIKIRLNHIKSLVNKDSFTSADLIQYTKKSNFKLLNDENKRLVNLLIKEMLLKEDIITNEQIYVENQETVSKLEWIHIQIQQMITQKEILGYKIRLKHIKAFVNKNFFTSADLIQYTKASNFNLLNTRAKRLINLLINEMSSNKNNTTKLKQPHTQIITKENENLEPSKTTNDESDESEYGLFSCFAKYYNFSSSSSQINSFDQENQETDSKLELIHFKLQQIATQKETLGIKIKFKHISTFVKYNSLTSADLIQYTKTSNFNLLNERIKILINRHIRKMSSEDEVITTNLEKLHAQINAESKIKGESIKRRDFNFLYRTSNFKILIPYTKTQYFDSLSIKIKNFVNIIIYDVLKKEFIVQNLKLSQNLEEYTKRGLIPPLPAGYDSYAEYENSIMFCSLSKKQKSRVSKLVKFQKQEK
ncbi:9790_t:CDS:1 [Funneliformis geosporum]|uniref:14847_t:CDS:1 n=1 Tax=Funneliformis geosporum TaxID=1117311 RepID=A0A9W4SW41_9GLOM|nr:9790_t:CDS:1 [Funneliformis geosporum]CAI2183572.1 14847_t:CDS:1 [Funneliformis geosporum]